MKKFFLVIFLLIFACTFVHADYKSDMAAGNAAYKKGEFEQSLKYYESALDAQPSGQLFAFTDKIRKKIAEKKQKEQAASGGSDKTALIALDAALAGFAVFSYLDYSSSATSYEELFTAINNTTPESYKMLVYEKKQVEQKGTFVAFAAGAAGAAVVYTLVDIFVLSGSPSNSVSAWIDPVNEYAVLNTNWRF